MGKSKILYPKLAGEIASSGDTYNELARLLKVSTSAISRRMSGEVEWSINEAKTICAHYGKRFDDLFD